MNLPNFMSKALSYQDLRWVGHYVPPLSGMIRQQHHGADRVKGIDEKPRDQKQ